MRHQATATAMKSSTFERVLRRARGAFDFRMQLLCELDLASLRSLRATCRMVHHAVDRSPRRISRNLCVTASPKASEQKAALRKILTFCYELHIRIDTTQAQDTAQQNSAGKPPAPYLVSVDVSHSAAKQPARSRLRYGFESATVQSLSRVGDARLSLHFDSMPSAQKTELEILQVNWLAALALCHQVRTLHAHINGDSGWPGRTETEEARRSLAWQHHLPA
jgi:hypothetical protein